MKRALSPTLWACCVLFGLSLSVVAASSATAALPELGRCVPAEETMEGKKTVHHGAFSNHGCTKVNATHTGKYEWLPGPGPEGKAFTGHLAAPAFETNGGIRIECGSGHVEGEYTGAKTATITKLELTTCVSGTPAKFCQTELAVPDVIKNVGNLEAELGPLGGAKSFAGWDLKSGTPVFLTFTCGDKGEVESVNTIEGSVIGPIHTGGRSYFNRMNKTGLVRYKQTAGVQLPEAFEGGSKDTLTLTQVQGVGHTTEPIGFESEEELATVEALEVKTK